MSDQAKTIVGVLAGSLVVVFAVAFLFSRQAAKPVDMSQIIGDARWATGSAEPKVTIVEFSDFQCPACKASSPLIRQIIEDNREKVRLVYRHFPITSAHKNALEAAVATEIAGVKGKFWEMHDMLFERQDEWSDSGKPREVFAKYAEEIGISRDEFNAGWNSSDYEKKVREDMRDARVVGVSSTPSIFVDDSRVSVDDLGDVVASLLVANEE